MRTRWLIGTMLAAVILLLLISGKPQTVRSQTSSPASLVHFRVLLGIGDTEPARWDGSVRVTGGRIAGIEIWRPGPADGPEGPGWKVSTRRLPPQGAAAVKAGRPGPMLENGVLVAADLVDRGAKFEVQTVQGNFSFNADQITLGDPRPFLNGRVSVERAPSTVQLTNSIEEQDYPAVAQSGDTAYIAYVEFTHGDRSQKWPQQMAAKPASFDSLTRPAGGDQVMLIEYSISKKTWSAPYAVTAPRQDICRAAVAVDREGRLWVIWSAQIRGNFDLYARARRGGSWGDEIRITQDPGHDLNPVAVTDSTGAVWVAWQGYRKDNFDALVVRQRGSGFAKEERVSTSPASDWDPQIAAGPNGEVAVVWDTYDKGDYDVYLRRMRFNGRMAMDAPIAIAATQKFEARATVAYGRDNRTWVGYEESFPGWGKDFGAYETTGAGLYQGSTVRVKALEGGQFLTTADRLEDTIETTLVRDLPNGELAKDRRPNVTPYGPGGSSQGFPRLATDSQGIVFLSYRTAAPATRGPLGSVWFENVAYFDGRDWAGPVFIPHSDNLLDNRPAVISPGSGDLLMIASTDHRLAVVPGGARVGRGVEAANNDLVLATLKTGALARKPELVAAAAEAPEAPMPGVKAEIEQVALARNYRVALGNEKLQLLRGEFHRHTENSGDGGRDGPLIDAYRYMLDAAYMDWVGCCDHDNGNGREYTWWTTQKLTDAFYAPGRFIPVFSYERSVRYPEGHRNVVFAQRGVRPLPRLPKMADDSPPSPAPDTQMLYEYLRKFDGIAASHTSGTDMGTDWRDNDPKVEPAVEIYQGDRQNYEMPDAPRANSSGDSIGGWQPLGFVSLALKKGYRLGFQASSDHISTHMSYCNLWVTEPTRKGVLDAFKKRRVYGATDNILADVTAHGHFMGEEFKVTGLPTIRVKLVGTAEFAKVHIIKDGNYVYSIEPRQRLVEFMWRDNDSKAGATSCYYVRGEQSDGELVWVSPMWITVQ